MVMMNIFAKNKTTFEKYYLKCNILFVISSLLMLLLVLLGLAVFLIVPPDDPAEVAAITLLFFPVARELMRRYSIARDRLGLVAITQKQFPDIYTMVEELATEAGLETIPKVFMRSSPSIDPCTANLGLRQDIVIGTDFYAGCLENDAPEALRFMIAHQIGHFVAGHNKNRNIWVSAAIMGVPVVKTIFIRNLEFAADHWAAIKAPRGATAALAMCSVGKDVFASIDADELIRTHLASMGKLSKIARWTTQTVPAPERIFQLHTDKMLPDT